LESYTIAVAHDQPRPPWTARKLLQAIAALRHEPLYLRLSDASVDLDGYIRLSYRPPEKPDIVIVKGLGHPARAAEHLSMIAMIEEAGAYVLNPWRSLCTAWDKARAAAVLRARGLPVAETEVSGRHTRILALLASWGRIVVKPLRGSQGLGVMLLDDVDVAYHILQQLPPGEPLLVQRYIEKEGGRDYRVIVIDGEAKAWIARVGGWKTNIARGARPEKAELGDDILALAVDAAETLGLLYAGVDIAIDSETGEPVILEVNAAPLWRGLLSVTGYNPAYDIVKLAIDKLQAKTR